MTSAAPASRTESSVNEWKARQETPSILFFTDRKKPSQGEISDMLTRKFREFFP